MSVYEGLSPNCEQEDGAIETLIHPRPRELDGLAVRHLLPAKSHRSVGPFVFFDEMGPAELPAGRGVHIPPHPHIGLATITYLFEGALLHRDSLGTEREIHPGAINWMTAGRGIVHSESTPTDLIEESSPLHGVQIWVALSEEHEEDPPSFEHCPVDTLPEFEQEGCLVRLLAGSAYGRAAPVRTTSPLFYCFVMLKAGASLRLPDEHAERGVFCVDGEVHCNDTAVPPHSIAVIRPKMTTTITATSEARVLCFGGAPLEARRYMEWNYVSTRAERIQQAKKDWEAGRLGRVLTGNGKGAPSS